MPHTCVEDNCGSRFSFPTLWGLGIKPKLLDLATSTLTHLTILLAKLSL